MKIGTFLWRKLGASRCRCRICDHSSGNKRYDPVFQLWGDFGEHVRVAVKAVDANDRISEVKQMSIWCHLLNTQIPPSATFRIVERTAGVSTSGSKVWCSNSGGANVYRTKTKIELIKETHIILLIYHILCDISVRVLAGLNGEDLDVNLHEVGRKGVVLNFTPACGLDHLVFVAYAWVWGKTYRPNLPVKFNRFSQSQNLMK